MVRTKKIVFLTYIPSPYRVDFFNKLSEEVDLKVIYYNRSMINSPWKKEEKENKFEHLYLFDESKFKGILNLFRLLRSHKNDILVVGGYYLLPEILTIFYCIFFKKKFILNSDGGFVTKGFLKTNFKKLLISSADYWLSSGINTSETLIFYGAEPKKIYEYSFSSLHQNEIVNKPINRDELYRLKDKLQLNKDVRYLIFVGQLIPRKGVDVLLKSLPFLNDTDVEVLIIGNGPELENLRDIVQNHKIPCKVNFLGKQSKEVVLNYLKIADLFVFPSREDIWGLVLNEAVGNGLPVISTNRVGSAFSLIDQGKNGFIVDVDNPHILAQAINDVLSADLEKMKKRSLDIAMQFTVEEMVVKHLELFKICSDEKN